MKYTPMLRVRVDGQDYTYPKGTTFRAIAADFQSQFPHDILLVRRDEKLCELSKKLDRDCTLRFLTIQDKPGIQTYERTAVLLMLRAFYDVAGRDNVSRLMVEYSLSPALYLRYQGSLPLDEALLSRVEGRMRSLCEAALPSKNALWTPMMPYVTLSSRA